MSKDLGFNLYLKADVKDWATKMICRAEHLNWFVDLNKMSTKINPRKRYEVCASYTLCATYYINAESEQQAMSMAKDNLSSVTTDILAASYNLKTKYSAIKPEYISQEVHVDSVEKLAENE